MGIFDRFKNQTQKQQLEDVQKGASVPSDTKKVQKKEGAKSTKNAKAVKTKKEEVKSVAPKKSKSGVVVKRVLVRPVVSEKSTHAVAQGKYTFVVVKGATKVDVKNEVRALYGVEPTGVHVMNFDGKRVRFGRRQGRRSDWKKAIVTLPKGKTISVHEGV